MKKTLFFGLILSTGLFSAQVLESDNYNSYTLGNVGTEFTGTTPGQGGMYLYNGVATDYQIASVDATHGQSLQITGGATAASASSRYVWKDAATGLEPAWAARTAGNDFLVGDLEIYTGTATGAHRIGSAIYATDGTGIVGITYNSSTKTINGLARLDNGTTASFYNITGLTTTTWPANTWIKVGYSYDYTTGTITYTFDGTTVTLSIAGYTTPANLDASEHDIIMPYVTGNTATMTAAVDNVTLEANSVAHLGTSNVGQIGDLQLSVFPNPTTDVLNINSQSKVKAVKVYDATGKKANVTLQGKRIDVRNLAKGVYILNVTTENGTESVKFIKK